MSKKNVSKSIKSSIQSFEEIPLLHPSAAGIDIATEEHWVCIPPGRAPANVLKFGSYTRDLQEICDWLRECGVTTVAMESTSVYWIPLYQMLESKGIEVYLVNARQIKNVPGRTKTDKLDCQWIQKLHSFGLLSASFRPDEQTCQLRSYLRHRDNLIRKSSKEIQYMQKSLDQMNVLLHKVVTDITGKTGIKIIEAILSGQHDASKLSKMRYKNIKCSEKEIALALNGDFRSEHLFSLEQSLMGYKFIQLQIESCEHEIELLLEKWHKKAEYQGSNRTLKNLRGKASIKQEVNKARLYEVSGVDLTEIPSFNISTIQTMVSETGLDMSKWKSAKHFASWLGLCPCPDISGGKVLKHKTKKVQSRAAKALRLTARTVARSESYLGAFYRRLKARVGPSKAITATAHKLAIIYYKMLKEAKSYKELGVNYYAQNHERRILRSLKKKAELVGYQLVPIKEG